MLIELRKAGFVNKGAELMLLALLKRLSSAFPDAVYTMAPTRTNGSQPFEKLVAMGFYPKASLYRYGLQWGDLAGLLPARLREMYGLVLDRDVDVVIDAAGFSYSDRWGARNVRELAQATRRWKRRGTRVILMPQAFGPFTGRRMRRHMREAIEHADLVMPRDRSSYQLLVDAAGESPNIHVFPDFTNLIEGAPPPEFEPHRHQVCLVPNYRMIDKTGPADSDAYLPFMQRCARYLTARGANPFILVHEGANDRWLAERISESAGNVPILSVENPLAIKGILGESRATIGSRFHGLVSALSQGVPSLATGWSHKYQELCNDYGCPDALVPVTANGTELEDRIDRLIDEPCHSRIRAGLLERSRRLKAQSEAMWDMVLRALDAPRSP